MPVITTETDIDAPPEVCFDLARSVEAHLASTPETSERALGGVTSGLLELGDEVTWEARHLGVTQRLTARMTAFDRPRHFRDEMIRGAFKRFVHDHRFIVTDAGTCMVDELDFAAPLGPLGWLAERLFLTSYMRRFLARRALELKRMAEAG